MEPKKLSFFLLLSIFVAVTLADEEIIPSFKYVRRSQFGDDFYFGLSSSAYQMEGAAHEGGRGESTWDRFIKDFPEKIQDGSNADVAADQYHRYKDDVKLMKEDIGLNAYRLSISWPRILPKGIRGISDSEINWEGVAYYRNLTDELLSKGITPFVTIYHWDLPEIFEEEFESFLSSEIVYYYAQYADLCFKLFGDKVKHWATFNEPMIFCFQGYSVGGAAPGRCKPAPEGTCKKGDPTREPYKACHNLLIAHAEAVKIYRDYYQKEQKGTIGIVLNSNWKYPYSQSPDDIKAVQRSLDFEFGWFMDPLTKGDYPENMRSLLGNRLPNFTKHDSKLLEGSFDYIGINYYTSDYPKNVPLPPDFNPDIGLGYPADSYVESQFTNLAGVPIGNQTDIPFFNVNPKGLKNLLLYTKDRYKNPDTYIFENGIATGSDPSLPVADILNDEARVEFLESQLLYLVQAIREGVNLKGYLAWSFTDGFEWGSGFTLRFGLIHVDYKNKSLDRILKKSAKWYNHFLKT